MVWSTTQSALYSDLSRYYEDEKKFPKNPENSENIKEKNRESPPERKCEKRPQNFDNNREKKCENKNPPVCPNFRNCPNRSKTPGDPISRMISEKFSDNDMLLIAGLIFLLMKQGADKKLILALAFVLLS